MKNIDWQDGLRVSMKVVGGETEEVRSNKVYVLGADAIKEAILEKRESLAALEHEQWAKWAASVIHEVDPERAERWQGLMIPYGDLSHEEKEKDRVWADKVLNLLD